MMQAKHKKLVLGKYVWCLIFLLGCSFNSHIVQCKIFSCECGSIKYVNLVDEPYEGVSLLNNDTLYYSIGFAVSNLSETPPNVVYIPHDFPLDTSMNKSDVIFTNRKDFDIDNYRRQNIYITHEKQEVRKFTFPIDSNKGGIIGLFIDSLAIGNDGIVKFSAFVRKPTKGNYKNILGVLKSIKIHLRPYNEYLKTKYIY